MVIATVVPIRFVLHRAGCARVADDVAGGVGVLGVVRDEGVSQGEAEEAGVFVSADGFAEEALIVAFDSGERIRNEIGLQHHV